MAFNQNQSLSRLEIEGIAREGGEGNTGLDWQESTIPNLLISVKTGMRVKASFETEFSQHDSRVVFLMPICNLVFNRWMEA